MHSFMYMTSISFYHRICYLKQKKIFMNNNYCAARKKAKYVDADSEELT